jgi:UDP-N-acetylglucosamine:LPS N-acetylglucosamine transferase
VVIVSARVGAGHDAAATQIAARLSDAGIDVVRCDFLDVVPRWLARSLMGTYRGMLGSAPWTWRATYALLDRSRILSVLVRMLTVLAGRKLGSCLPADARFVVSTYHLSGQVLGRMRRNGLLTVPVFTYLTDFSVHRLWVSKDVDGHLALDAETARQATEHGAHGVTVVAPLVDRRFTGPAATPVDKLAARASWGLPADTPIALLVGGSWGVGEIEESVADVRATGVVRCAVVCGQNDALRQRLLDQGIEHVFGWVEDMPGLMRAADVLVQNAGGMTSLEALASSLPVLSYRCIPGHGHANAAALDAAGAAPWVREKDQLAGAIMEAVRTGVDPAPWFSAPNAADVMMAAAGLSDRPVAAVEPRPRVRTGRARMLVLGGRR